MSDHEERADYLAGESAGLDLQADERAALDRIGRYLQDPGAWEEPASDGQFRLLAAATQESRDSSGVAGPPATDAGRAEPIDLTDTTARPKPVPRPRSQSTSNPPVDNGRRDQTKPGNDDDGIVRLVDRRRSGRGRSAGWFGAGALVAAAAAAIAVVATGRLDAGSPDAVLESELAVTVTYDLTATPLDPDTVATLDVVPTPAGVELWLHAAGLDNTEGPDYYTAWLAGPGEMIPLGSFHWRKGVPGVILWSGVDDPAYNQFIVTRQTQGDGGMPSDEVVLMGSVPDLTSGN